MIRLLIIDFSSSERRRDELLDTSLWTSTPSLSDLLDGNETVTETTDEVLDEITDDEMKR